MPANLNMTAMTDTGLVREENQDWVHTDPGQRLFALADGVGGRAGGAIASRLAVDTICEQMRIRLVSRLFRFRRRLASPIQRMTTAVQAAHLALRRQSETDPSLQGMSCTIVAGRVAERHCDCVAVGDSRLYRFSNGRLTQITQDQTLARKLVEEGFVEPGDARLQQYEHMLTTVLGGEEAPAVQQYRVPFEQGDVLLACSDGLSGMLGGDQISAVLQQKGELDELASSLVDQAKEAGGKDNISVILIGDTRAQPAQGYLGKQGGETCHNYI